MEDNRPNIILIMADQLRSDCIQPNNEKIQTPNIQKLADKGIIFERTYAPTPVCAPCRASIVTGQYPSTHGLTNNSSHLPEDYFPSIASILRKHGYYTHIIGKSHLNSCHDINSTESAPHIFNYEYFRNWHGPWYGFEHADISIGHTTEKHASGMHYGAWLEDHGVDIEKYFGNTSYIAHGAWDLPEEFHSSKWIADVSIDSIKKCHQGNNPFFLWVNFQDPHNPCMVPEPWSSMYDPKELPQYGFKEGEPQSFGEKPTFYNDIINQKGAYACRPSDKELTGSGNVSSLKWDQEEIQQNAAHYYGMVSLIDKHIGRILKTLEETGEIDNTLIIFTADHGDLLGDHGMFWKSLVCFEEHINVPFIVSYPKQLPISIRSNKFHSLVDIAPTILSMLGEDGKRSIPHSMEGVSQLEVWKDPNSTEISCRNDVIVEERPYSTEFNVRVLINENYKLCFYANREFGELYDLKKDPDHLHNLWKDAEFAEIKNKMIMRLLSESINKARPRPGPTEFNKREYELYHFGKFTSNEEGQLCINMATTVISGYLMEIPMYEILEDYLGKEIILKIDDKDYCGIIKENEEELVTFEQKDGKILNLNEIGSHLVDYDCVIMTLKKQINPVRNMNPIFCLHFEEK